MQTVKERIFAGVEKRGEVTKKHSELLVEKSREIEKTLLKVLISSDDKLAFKIEGRDNQWELRRGSYKRGSKDEIIVFVPPGNYILFPQSIKDLGMTGYDISVNKTGSMFTQYAWLGVLESLVKREKDIYQKAIEFLVKKRTKRNKQIRDLRKSRNA